ncbi:hypothetical protein FE257_010930 [Aspergillus nanangensis]|uniref:RNA recognition motif-containing protein n=1 Tax=Aspergillus nanangensis TaxID=2582783 RepID=A0AAD4CW66_ASPNN|nr:hypothetical protein FE257_010930 [Aspergillus nanangensis]
MPPLPSEERMLTVFADIHCYFSAPSPRPVHHRFDKGSYVYIYYSATQHKARLEVANNPGTAVQDAFNGALDRAHLRHSSKFPTLCTLTVDGVQAQDPAGLSRPPNLDANSYEWRLPSNDGASPESFRLHTLDIYFWTENDASQFLNIIEKVLSPSQVETDRHPFPPPPQSMSNVVQQLENVAISDPAYQNGQTRNSLSEPTAATIPSTTATPQSIPGSNSISESTPTPAPLPYNPAAPAAPEPIQHREKTPPPPMDGHDGTGLAAAAADTHAYGSFGPVPGTPGYGAPPGPPGPPPPPQTITHQSIPYSMPGSYASPPPSAGLPPPSAGLSHGGSFPPSMQSPGLPTTTAPPTGSVPSYNPSFLAGGSSNSTPGPPQPMMSFAPPPKDPNAHLYGQPPQQQQQQPYNPYAQAYPHMTQPTSPPPIGGYSNYSYDTTPKPTQTGIGDYTMHNQLYRPTEAEANSYHQKYAQAAMQNPRARGLEDKAHRVESSVNKFLKRLEKKI